MFWLIWQMGVLLVIFFGLGLLVGYMVWSGDARSGEADKRAHHNALERKRRDHIKDSFTMLRDTIPSINGEKVCGHLTLRAVRARPLPARPDAP